MLIPFGMRSAAVAGLCRESTNRAVPFVLCPYKAMPPDRRKVAAVSGESIARSRCREPRPRNARARTSRVHRCATARTPLTGGRWVSPAAVCTHAGPGPVAPDHFTKTVVTVLLYRNRRSSSPVIYRRRRQHTGRFQAHSLQQQQRHTEYG